MDKLFFFNVNPPYIISLLLIRQICIQEYKFALIFIIVPDFEYYFKL